MEVTPEILDELPRFKLVEAAQAAERGDETCPVCGEPVTGPDDAAVLAYFGLDCWFYLALSHRDCRRSAVLEHGDPLVAEMSPDAFALAWRHVLRSHSPRAVLLWENKTNFDAVPSFDDVGSVDGGPGWLGYSLRQEGFAVADDDLAHLTAPRPETYFAVERDDGLELRWGAVHSQSFPGPPPRAWQAVAAGEAEVLLVHGTALQLEHFDPDHFQIRVERGKVVAGVVPYRRRTGSVRYSLESAPDWRGMENADDPARPQ